MASSHLLKELHTEVSDRPMEIAEAEAAANDAVANGKAEWSGGTGARE
jgi:hypothetical protein